MSSRTKHMDKTPLLLKICKMYYFEDKTQQEISRIVGISRPQISRLLKKARDMKIVEVKLNTPQFTTDEQISEALEKKYKLKEAIVVETSPTISTRETIGKATANFLNSHLKNDQIIGIGWGRTLARTVDHLIPTLKLSNAIFIPLLGGVGQQRYEYQVNTLVEKIANAFDSKRYYLHAPAFLDDAGTLEHLKKDKNVREVIDFWEKMNLALVGIGEPISRSHAFSSYFDMNYVLELDRLKAVGDICAHFFDENGRPCKFLDYDERILGISLDILKTIPEVIGIAGGKSKVKAMVAAMKSRYINSLITDSTTARMLLEEE
ncbi:MAG: sugar-binding transcriptional regulator [Thermotogae bacterium]|nr:sugar-binding transcriptional regulator [Thermotogota bacterium]